MNDQNTFEQEFNSQLDIRDKDVIDRLTNGQALVYAEFLRQADEQGIDPQPVPHVHTPNQEISDRCFWGMFLTHAGGAIVGAVWSALTVSRTWLAMAAAVLLYAILAVSIDLLLAVAWPRRAFMRLFRWLVIIPVPVLVACAGVILMERFATPELAPTLLALDPYAWSGLELSLLFLGAVAYNGYRRFGWSGVLFSAYQQYDEQIAELKHRLASRARVSTDQSTKNSSNSTAQGMIGLGIIVLLGTMFVVPTAARAAGCPAVMIDRTGSLAQQEIVEARLVSELVRHAAAIPCLAVIPFSDHIFGAQKHEIFWTQSRPTPFSPMKLALDQRVQKEAGEKIRDALNVRLPLARCTSVPDMLLRAEQEGRTFVISDWVHTCGNRGAPTVSDSENVIVVVVSSNHDQGNDSDMFKQRQRAIHRYMPKALVLPEFQLENAVRLLFSSAEAPGLMKSAF